MFVCEIHIFLHLSRKYWKSMWFRKKCQERKNILHKISFLAIMVSQFFCQVIVFGSKLKLFLLMCSLTITMKTSVNRSFRNYWIIWMKNTYSYYSELLIYFFNSLQLHFTSHFRIITSSKPDFFFYEVMVLLIKPDLHSIVAKYLLHGLLVCRRLWLSPY